jgi:hypothetical protein
VSIRKRRVRLSSRAFLIFLLVGIPLLIGLGLFDLIVTVIAAINANDGVKYRYPLCIRFVS